MNQAILILKKSLENVKSEAIRANNELNGLEISMRAKNSEITHYMNQVAELEEAILKLEKKDVPTASKNKKVK